MSYRVEVASSGRAGCQSTDCKKAGIKISKNELRLGTWVDIPDRGGSWRWRHWGCVTGRILLNIREALDATGSGNYSWDSLDGYQGDEKNSLKQHPDLQEKVRRVITQGFIDHEDFKGDPEMNKLGCSGLGAPASKKKKLPEDNNVKSVEELKMMLNKVAADRNNILENGGSTTEIDGLLKILQQELADAEQKNSSQNKIKRTVDKGTSRKRGRKVENSDTEETKEEVDKPAKKKRVSAKDKKILEEASRAIKCKDGQDMDGEDKKNPSLRNMTSRDRFIKKEEEDEKNEFNNMRQQDKSRPTSSVQRKKAIKKEENISDASDNDNISASAGKIKKNDEAQHVGNSIAADVKGTPRRKARTKKTAKPKKL